MIERNVETIGLRRVDGALAHVASEIKHLKPLWELIGVEVRAEETRLFDEAPWEPLSESYAKQKAQEHGDKPTLRATDVLWKSLTQENAPGNISRVDDDGAQFGSSNPLAKIHQAGTKDMPAREVLIEFDEARAETIAGEHVIEILNNAGF